MGMDYFKHLYLALKLLFHLAVENNVNISTIVVKRAF